MLEEILPDCDGVRDVIEATGFQLLASEIIMQTIASNATAYADKLSAGGDSVLARLTRQELEAGLVALRLRFEKLLRALEQSRSSPSRRWRVIIDSKIHAYDLPSNHSTA